MKYIGMLVVVLIVGMIGMFIGEWISRIIRNDTSTKGDDLLITWIFKGVVSFILILLVLKGCK